MLFPCGNVPLCSLHYTEGQKNDDWLFQHHVTLFFRCRCHSKGEMKPCKNRHAYTAGLLLPRRHRILASFQTPEAALRYLTPRCQQQSLSHQRVKRWGPRGSDLFVRHIPPMLVWIEIWSTTKMRFCAYWNIPEPLFFFLFFFFTLRDRRVVLLKEAAAIRALTGSSSGPRYKVHLSSKHRHSGPALTLLDLVW